MDVPCVPENRHPCLIQIGCYMGILGSHTRSIAELLRYKCLKGWRGFREACGFPKKHLAKVEYGLRCSRMPCVLVE